jgi:integrase/recombinase XerD
MQKDSEQELQSTVAQIEEVPVEQDNLFGTPIVVDKDSEIPFPSSDQPLLTDQSSMAECTEPYRRELLLRGKSNYTITCFLSDLKMLTEFFGPETPVGRIRKENVSDWLMKLKFGTPGVTPAPKTMARRVTFLKNFFSWLEREHIIQENPAASLVLERPMPPLPELLTDEEVQCLVEAAQEDARCLCLVYLVLKGGLKKEEVMGLKVHHVDLDDPAVPMVTVRFSASTNKQHRERRIAMPPEFTGIFRRYLHDYHVYETVFSCTDRNLNYILARAVKAADIKKRVTLQLLRDTFAVQLLREGGSFDVLREKLGLSDEAWLESKEKYRRLAFPNTSEEKSVATPESAEP